MSRISCLHIQRFSAKLNSLCLQKQFERHRPRSTWLFQTSQSRSLSSQNSGTISNSKSRRVSLVSTISGLVVLFGIGFMNRTRLSKQNSNDDSHEIYRDPHCQGRSGTLVKIGQYWLPFEFFNKTSTTTKIQDFVVRNEDVIVGSFPKSGTTWVQEIVFLIVNDADLVKSQKATIEERFPYIEYIYPGLQSLTERPSPRYLKTHLPWHLLPNGICEGTGKIVYVARNPKDVAVSYYHFVKMLTVTQYMGKFYDFYESFMEGKVAYGPWDRHVSEYWEHRDDDNVLFITYEDLYKNPKNIIQKIATFLDRSLTVEQIEKIAQHCSFTRMKENPMVNYSWWDDLGLVKKGQTQFMRKGTIGDWKHHFSQNMCSTMDQAFVKPLDRKGLTFIDEL